MDSYVHEQHKALITSHQTIVLKYRSLCPLVTTFELPSGQMIAHMEEELCCGCFLCAEKKEQDWHDVDDRLVMMVMEEERKGIFSTRRAAVVNFPASQFLAKVVIKTSSGKQNNFIQDGEERVMATFERKNRIFGTSTTSFMSVDGRYLARMKHQNGTRGKVVIEFGDGVDSSLRVGIMTAGILYRKIDMERQRRSAAAAASSRS